MTLTQDTMAMELEQHTLVEGLTNAMNEAMTAWVVTGPFELTHVTNQVAGAIPSFKHSVAQDDGFGHCAAAELLWICMDGERGSGIFLFPRNADLFNREIHSPLLGLKPGLLVAASIYGSVDPDIWNYLAGAEVLAARSVLS